MPTFIKNEKDIPSPAFITKAVHDLTPFSTIEILDLGLETKPQYTQLHNFNILPSSYVTDSANINAKEVFIKGMDYGKSYELKGSYLILAESSSSTTTTAIASIIALGYDLKNIKTSTIDKSLSLINDEMNNFEKLGIVSNNILLFCAGFLLEASRRFHVVLAGGVQLAACLLIADKLKGDVLMRVKSDNITLATTAWIAKDENSNIQNILSNLSYTPHAIYTDFSFASAEIPALKKYDDGKAKEGAGAGAALAYAVTNKQTNEEVLEAIEYLIYIM